jgi:hypothetical protein
LPTTQRPNINPSSRSISLIQIVAHLSPRSSRYSADPQEVGEVGDVRALAQLAVVVERGVGERGGEAGEAVHCHCPALAHDPTTVFVRLLTACVLP